MPPTIMKTVPLGISPESKIEGLPFLEGGVILGIIEEDVELDKSGKEDEEETTDVIVLLELAVVVEEVEVVNFGRPLLEMVITVILAF